MLSNDTKKIWDERIKQIRKNKLRSFTKNGRKKVINKYYKIHRGYEVDFDNPKNFSEKLQVRKLSNNKLFTICADKDKVRKYVEEKIGKKYLVKQYFSKRRIKVSDLEALPNRFVLKTNNGSSTNIVVYDKRKENLKDLCDKMNYFATIDYGYLWGEYYYTKIPVRIIAEELLIDHGELPNDFKIHCFNKGSEKHKFFESFYTVDGHLMKNIYDENWDRIDYQYGFGSDGRTIKKPKQFKEIKEVCDKLSRDFNYVRVDLYLCKDRIYFGELTFTSGAGFARFSPEEKDELWGKYMGDEC